MWLSAYLDEFSLAHEYCLINYLINIDAGVYKLSAMNPLQLGVVNFFPTEEASPGVSDGNAQEEKSCK